MREVKGGQSIRLILMRLRAKSYPPMSGRSGLWKKSPLQHLFQICSKEEGRCVWEEANTISNPFCMLMQQFERSSKFPQCCEKVFSSRYLFSRVKPTRLPRTPPPPRTRGRARRPRSAAKGERGERGRRLLLRSASPPLGKCETRHLLGRRFSPRAAVTHHEGSTCVTERKGREGKGERPRVCECQTERIFRR